jgi:hypothetical protein
MKTLILYCRELNPGVLTSRPRSQTSQRTQITTTDKCTTIQTAPCDVGGAAMNEARSCESRPASGRHLSLNKGNYSVCARRMHHATMHGCLRKRSLFSFISSSFLFLLLIPPYTRHLPTFPISSTLFSFSSSPLASRYISFPLLFPHLFPTHHQFPLLLLRPSTFRSHGQSLY